MSVPQAATPRQETMNCETLPDERGAGALLASIRFDNGSRLQVVSVEAANAFDLHDSNHFPDKVYAMVTEATSRCPDAIRWVDDGAGFQMCRTNPNLEMLLRKYFKHGNYQSMHRQLNMYGWKKRVVGPHKGAFFHPDFHQHLIPHGDFASIQRRARRAPIPRIITPPPIQPIAPAASIPRRAPLDRSAAPTTVPKRSTSNKAAPSKRKSTSTKAGVVSSTMTTPRPDFGRNCYTIDPSAQVTPFQNANRQDRCEMPTFTSPVLVAGSRSCITSESALWTSSDHDSITPQVQNPRLKRHVLQRIQPSMKPEYVIVPAPKRGKTEARNDAAKVTERHPVWISPPVTMGSAGRVGVDENARGQAPFDARLRAAKALDCRVEGVRIPVTPILVRRRPKEEDKDSTLYSSPMVPTPLSLRRQGSSSSFLEPLTPVSLGRQGSSSSFLNPFEGVTGQLSRALDVEHTDGNSDGNNILSDNSCSPIQCEPSEDVPLADVCANKREPVEGNVGQVATI